MKNFTAEKGVNWISTEMKKKLQDVEAQKALDSKQNYILKKLIVTAVQI